MASIPVYNPQIPFLGLIPGTFRPSMMIRVRGSIRDAHSRCNIDFIPSPAISSNQNIMFHISLRPYENAIIRNHFELGRWGHEERYGKYKVRHHETFELHILADHEFYKIAYNGQHIGVFRHRLPLHLVNYIQVSGDVRIDHILYEQDLSTAAAAAQVPQGQAIIVSQTTSSPSYGEFGMSSHTTTVPSVQPIYPPIPPSNVYVMQSTAPQPPPPYQPPGTSTIFKLGGIAIEKQQGGFAIKKEKKDIFKF